MDTEFLLLSTKATNNTVLCFNLTLLLLFIIIIIHRVSDDNSFKIKNIHWQDPHPSKKINKKTVVQRVICHGLQ